MAEEQVLLEGDDAFVSTTRVVIGGTTYSTSNITSVSKRVTSPSVGCAVLMMIAGVLSLGVLLVPDLPSGLMWVWGVLGLAAVVTGYLWFKSLKPTYHVVLASSSGETDALSSHEQGTIDKLIEAISAAIVARG